MDRLSELIHDYYNAIFNQDEERKAEVLSQIRGAIYTIIINRGSTALTYIASLFEELPSQLSYTPSDEVVDQVTQDLRDVLVGLEQRMYNEIEKEGQQNEEADLAEILAIVQAANLWQVTRITDSEDHIIGERAEIDVIYVVFFNLGYIIEKTWETVIDEKTCPVCLEMNGTTIPFGEVFIYNGSEITLDSHYSEFAHAHSHCRCRLKYTIRRG